ncbi:MAG: GNAT family N-acetyltransferase [Ilumatobacteraceae bacterium]
MPNPPSIREYAPGDLRAGRGLWAELTLHHRRIYDDPTIGGDDPGAYFDVYLAASDRVASWVAVVDGEVVGLTGLLDHGGSGEIEPVVVTEARRGQGIGRLLVDHVVGVARARGYRWLAIRPVARNRAAIDAFYAAGFRTLGGHVDLTMDLAPRVHRWLPGGRLHDLEVEY